MSPNDRLSVPFLAFPLHRASSGDKYSNCSVPIPCGGLETKFNSTNKDRKAVISYGIVVITIYVVFSFILELME